MGIKGDGHTGPGMPIGLAHDFGEQHLMPEVDPVKVADGHKGIGKRLLYLL